MLLTIAGEASADPITVRRMLEGKPGRSQVRSRIHKALEARGLLHLLPGIVASSDVCSQTNTATPKGAV